MKRILILLLFYACQQRVEGQGFHQLSFPAIAGDSVSLNSYAGKKVMFYVLPPSAASVHYQQLQAFKARYGDTVKIVGIASLEDGLVPLLTTTLQTLYGPLGIAITGGMYTRKASPGQSPLMKWLTHATHNRHFNDDTRGIGQKFFVNGNGRLYAVLAPATPLSAPMIDRIVHAPPSPVQ